MIKSVYISPSLQEKNMGVGIYGTEEKRMNQIAEVVINELKRHNIMTYRNKPEMTLEQAVIDSNRKKPDIHVAIHSNACNGTSRGCEVFVYKTGGEGEQLAKCLYDAVSAITPTKDRGVKINEKLYELRKTVSTTALIEVAFHDNPEDANWIIQNIEQIGVAIAKGILKYFGIPFIVATIISPDEMVIIAAAQSGILKDSSYWLSVIKGEKQATPGNIKQLVTNAVTIINGGK